MSFLPRSNTQWFFAFDWNIVAGFSKYKHMLPAMQTIRCFSDELWLIATDAKKTNCHPIMQNT
jgi:hypothetical protein